MYSHGFAIASEYGERAKNVSLFSLVIVGVAVRIAVLLYADAIF
jgi:hypothetical protein